MALYNTNISSDEAGITISLLESMNDAYNRNDIDTVMVFLTRMLFLIMQQDQTLTGPVLQAQRTSERYFKACLKTLNASVGMQSTPESLVTRLTANFIALQNLNLVKYRTF